VNRSGKLGAHAARAHDQWRHPGYSLAVGRDEFLSKALHHPHTVVSAPKFSSRQFHEREDVPAKTLWRRVVEAIGYVGDRESGIF